MSGSMMGGRKISGAMVGDKKLAGGMLGGKTLWATAAAGIAGMYGTGLGQVPMAFFSEDATLTGENVTAWENRGGAGSYFDLTGGLYYSKRPKINGPIEIATDDKPLVMKNHADMIGARLFAVVSWPGFPSQVGIARGFMKNNNYAVRLEGSTVLRMATGGPGAPAGISISVPSGVLIAGKLNLIEVECSLQKMSFFVSGKLINQATQNAKNYYIDRLFAASDTAATAASAYCVLSRITDGSAAMDAGNATIRQEMAAKYGISLS